MGRGPVRLLKSKLSFARLDGKAVISAPVMGGSPMKERRTLTLSLSNGHALIKLAFISTPAFAISQSLFVHDPCVVASTFNSFLRYILFICVDLPTPGPTPQQIHFGILKTPYLHSPDQGRKYCAGEIPRAWARACRCYFRQTAKQ